ncbi:MAG: hypothetical protein GY838_03850 [bacterium]|nr:hypothetical protein [bacterium]
MSESHDETPKPALEQMGQKADASEGCNVVPMHFVRAGLERVGLETFIQTTSASRLVRFGIGHDGHTIVYCDGLRDPFSIHAAVPEAEFWLWLLDNGFPAEWLPEQMEPKAARACDGCPQLSEAKAVAATTNQDVAGQDPGDEGGVEADATDRAGMETQSDTEEVAPAKDEAGAPRDMRHMPS